MRIYRHLQGGYIISELVLSNFASFLAKKTTS